MESRVLYGVSPEFRRRGIVPSPAQVRDIRVQRLASIARVLLESGTFQHRLLDKLDQIGFTLWPTLRKKTRREYVNIAIRMVLSRPHAEVVLPEKGTPGVEA